MKQTFSIAHASVNEFLRQGCVRIGSAKDFLFTSGTVHREMAEICLVYVLNIIDSEVPLDGDLLTHYPFAQMGTVVGIDCCRVANEDTSQDLTRVRRLITRLLESPKAFLKWNLLCTNAYRNNSRTCFLGLFKYNAWMCHAILMGKIREENELDKLDQYTEETVKLVKNCDEARGAWSRLFEEEDWLRRTGENLGEVVDE